MHRQNPTAAQMPSRGPDSDLFLGRLKQLQTRYPRLISDVRQGDLVIDIEFFLEDLALDATHVFLDAGISAVHRMGRPRTLSLQLPSLLDQHQEQSAIGYLDHFLRNCTRSANPDCEERS